jgi:hypothetical protein
MPAGHRRTGKTSRKRTVRAIVTAVLFCSAMSCVAPVLYASDCSRWVAEYKQGILQRRAAKRLRAAKYRLTALVRPPQPVVHHPMRRPMGPLEALRRFQIDCGDIEAPPELAAKLPTLPVIAPPLVAEFPQVPPPELPFPAVTLVAELTPPVPPLNDVPVTTTPFETIPVPTPVPEPGSLILVATGAMLALSGKVRRSA